MIRKALFITLSLLALCASGFASSATVNFNSCLTESKIGKQEQAALKSLQEQMTSLIQDTEKQLTDLSAKFNDSEYMDSRSPQAEEEMKARYAELSEEMNRYRSQLNYVMQQAQMKQYQTVAASVQEASKTVAEKKKLSKILDKNSLFYSKEKLDVTNLVIAEMDKNFEKKETTAANSK